jgi:hypothetical protein
MMFSYASEVTLFAIFSTGFDAGYHIEYIVLRVNEPSLGTLLMAVAVTALD